MSELPPGWYNRVLEEDLDDIVTRSATDLSAVGQTDLFLTGGTGFVGKWLSLSFLRAKQQLGLTGHLVLLARRPETFLGHLKDVNLLDGVETVAKDVRDIDLDDIPRGANLIHAATPTSAALYAEQPYEMFDVIVAGQRRLIDAAVARGVGRFLFLSSGAIYGRQPLDLPAIEESWTGAPDVLQPSNSYHEAKRAAEALGAIAASTGNLSFTTARLFAFLAPFLPLDEHFAAGNFVRDALAGGPIVLNSGGGSVRSYQYGTDLAVWIWAMLARGRSGVAYNTGSDEATSLLDLARVVAACVEPRPPLDVRGVDGPATLSRYVPNVGLATRELALSNHVSLERLVERTLDWNQCSR